MGRKMVPFSREIFGLLSSKVEQYGYRTEIRKMFGHEVHFLNGYMFAGANERGIFVHVGEHAKDEALGRESDVAPFEPLQGTTMKEYLLLEQELYTDEKRLKAWLDRSHAYLLTLPPREKNKKKLKTG